MALLIGGCSSPPAQFEVTDLNVQPPEAMPGEKVAVSIIIRNTGGNAGSQLMTLRMNGEAVETRDVQVEAKTTERVDFEVDPQAPGFYLVELGGLSGSFTVTMGLAQVI
ncbi:MAG: hypothetical protein QGH72_03360, partial [Dehalococcoidia bacterium]|nr:hypothetical protein [Dehalococcoidia bacterium]